MEKEQLLPELNKLSLIELAKKTIREIKALPLLEETKRHAEKRRSYPLSGAKANFKFIENIILPIISELSFRISDSGNDLKTGFKIKFGSLVQSNPEHRVEFVIRSKTELSLCLSKRNNRNDFAPFKKINRNHFKILFNQGGEEAEAIRAFGEMSKKEIALNAVSTIESMMSLNPEMPKPKSTDIFNHHAHFNIKTLFSGHRN